VRRKQAQCHTQDYTQQRDMVPLSGGLLVRHVAAALDNQCSRYKHICADVAMLDEVPHRDRDTEHGYAV